MEAGASTSLPALRVLIVDDDRLYAEALMLSLGVHDRIDVIGLAEDGAEAIEIARDLTPDIVLMDLLLPGTDGLDATREIVGAQPGASVIVLTNAGSEANVGRAREAGASAFVTKDQSISGLLDTIFEVGSLVTALQHATGESGST